MPTIQNQSLTLQAVGGGIQVTVSYLASFSPVEVFLMANGLVVEERIHLIGDDEVQAGGSPVYSSPPAPVAPAPSEVQLARTRQFDVLRARLQEDPSQPIYRWITWSPGQLPIRYIVGYTPDDDELRARAELTYSGFSPQMLVDTGVSVLAG